MDPFKKQRMSTFDEIEKEFGRMLRNMSAHRMFPFHQENLLPSCDVYETTEKFILYMEVPGIDPNRLSVTVDHDRVIISGERIQPVFEHTTCIHQLEVEYGKFRRTIDLDCPVDPDKASSTCKHGFLLIHLPKKQHPGHFTVTIKGE